MGSSGSLSRNMRIVIASLMVYTSKTMSLLKLILNVPSLWTGVNVT